MADNPNMPVQTASVAAMVGSTLELHVFTCDGYMVNQRVAGTNGWVDGTLSVAGSDVSAVGWADSNGFHIRAYCTNDDATVEWCLDPGSTTWVQGQYTS